MAPENTCARVLEVAGAEVGTVGGAKYVRFYNQLTGAALPEDADWCAMLVTWCMRQAGVPVESVLNYKGCSTGADWFRAQGRFYPRESGYLPRPGDVIFFEWNPENEGTFLDDGEDHTGIVESVESGSVHTIEGNSGNACRRRSWSLTDTDISGWGVPLYNQKEEQEMTYEQFREYQERYEAEQARKAASSWAQEALKYGKEFGIMVGDKSGNQMPQAPADRQDVMQMLYKVLCQFQTVEDMAGWARTAIEPLVRAGVLVGTGETTVQEIDGAKAELPVLNMSLIEVRVYCVIVRLLQSLGLLPQDLTTWVAQ